MKTYAYQNNQEKGLFFADIWAKNSTFFGLEDIFESSFMEEILENHSDKKWKIQEFDTKKF